MQINQYINNQSFSFCINGQATIIYEGKYKYTGLWENGMKIGKGLLEVDSYKLEVIIKQGQIHKCIKLLGNSFPSPDKIVFVTLPNLKITKVGESYKEENSDSERLCFMFRHDGSLFNSKAYPIKKYFSCRSEIFEIVFAWLQDTSPRIILDYLSQQMRFSGYSLFFTPYGDCKIIYEYMKIKARLIGKYFNGPCVVKHPDYTLFFDIELNSIKSPSKCVLKNLQNEFYLNATIKKVLNPEGKETNTLFFLINCKSGSINNQQVQEICDATMESFTLLKVLTKEQLFYFDPKLLTHLLAIDTNWVIFEKILVGQMSSLHFLIGKNNHLEELDEKCFRRLGKNEKFEGSVVNGKFEGFGKYYFADGSVYNGEFKNNLKNGIGTFRFKDGKMYRGCWVDNLMHGKGLMVNGDVKIRGIWERNQLKIENVCTFYNSKSRLD